MKVKVKAVITKENNLYYSKLTVSSKEEGQLLCYVSKGDKRKSTLLKALKHYIPTVVIEDKTII